MLLVRQAKLGGFQRTNFIAQTSGLLKLKIRSSGAGLNAYVAQTATGARLVVKGVDGAVMFSS